MNQIIRFSVHYLLYLKMVIYKRNESCGICAPKSQIITLRCK